MNPPKPRVRCPWCGADENMFIAALTVLVPNALGTWSLSGAQIKTTASFQTQPVLVCGACRNETVGWASDDDYVEFDHQNHRHLTDDDFAERLKYQLKTV